MQNIFKHKQSYSVTVWPNRFRTLQASVGSRIWQLAVWFQLVFIQKFGDTPLSWDPLTMGRALSPLGDGHEN